MYSHHISATRAFKKWPPNSLPLIIFILILLPGCQLTTPSLRQPDRLYVGTGQSDPAIVGKTEAEKSLADLQFAAAHIKSASDRNAFITARMYAIDVAYTNYEASLTHENQDVNFYANAATLGLTTTASLIPVAHTSRVLSAIAGGVTSLDTAYNEKVLIAKAIQNVQTQMRADRMDLAGRIYVKMACPLEAYPVGLAWSDLEAYYRAGTFTQGLVNLSNTVNNAKNEAKESKENGSSNAAVKAALAVLDKAASPPPCPIPTLL